MKLKKILDLAAPVSEQLKELIKVNMENLTKEKNIVQIKAGAVIDLKLINFLLGSLLLIFFIYYLIAINISTVKGFVLKDLRSRYHELSTENKLLNNEINRLVAYSNLNERIRNLKLVKTNEIIYVKKSEGAVAKK